MTMPGILPGMVAALGGCPRSGGQNRVLRIAMPPLKSSRPVNVPLMFNWPSPYSRPVDTSIKVGRNTTVWFHTGSSIPLGAAATRITRARGGVATGRPPGGRPGWTAATRHRSDESQPQCPTHNASKLHG